MDHSAHNKLISSIWPIADDCLRDVYVRGKYRDVTLPMVVLRHLDTLLEPSKDAVLNEVKFQKEEIEATELDEAHPMADSVRNHPDFEAKYENNPAPHNRELAFEKILKEVMLSRRKGELELYKLFAGDSAFKSVWTQSMKRTVGL